MQRKVVIEIAKEEIEYDAYVDNVILIINCFYRYEKEVFRMSFFRSRLSVK